MRNDYGSQCTMYEAVESRDNLGCVVNLDYPVWYINTLR